MVTEITHSIEIAWKVQRQKSMYASLGGEFGKVKVEDD
jgi:hypothetical protein